MNQRFALLLSVTLAACASDSARLLDLPGDYEALGLSPQPEAWEDGLRTDGGKGSFEWWYTDTEFEDGTTVVLVYYTKNRFDVTGPAHPTVTVEITQPDGRTIERTVQGPKGTTIQASTTLADVEVGDCYLRQQGDTYEVVFDDGEVRYEASMHSTVPAFRPETGHWTFGDSDDYFAWFVAQPAAEVEATLTIDGEERSVEGHGYHDHNWGNAAMPDLINHWYWGRATIGDVSIIAVDIIADKRFGYTRLPLMMVAENGELLGGAIDEVDITREETHIHDFTGKFVDDVLTFSRTVEDGRTFEVALERKVDLVEHSFLSSLGPWKRSLAKLVGANPTYLRMLGDVQLTVTQPSGEQSQTRQEGLWEQMFFGNNTEAVIGPETSQTQ